MILAHQADELIVVQRRRHDHAARLMCTLRERTDREVERARRKLVCR